MHLLVCYVPLKLCDLLLQTLHLAFCCLLTLLHNPHLQHYINVCDLT